MLYSQPVPAHRSIAKDPPEPAPNPIKTRPEQKTPSLSTNSLNS